MISQPLSRVFSFHNMAKAGKENQCGFSVLPAAARLENLGAKLGGRQLHISHSAPCLRKHCFHFLQKKLKTKFMWLFFFCGGGGEGEEGSKQGVLWEMCKWQILFISTEERQVEIIDSVTHFRSKVLFENIYQSKWRRIVIIVIFIPSVTRVGEFQSDVIESFCLLLSSLQTIQNFTFSRLQVGRFLCK